MDHLEVDKGDDLVWLADSLHNGTALFICDSSYQSEFCRIIRGCSMDHRIHSQKEESKKRTTVKNKGGQFLPIITDGYVRRFGLYFGDV